jgi:hypothetical protein
VSAVVVELARSIDGPGLLGALADHGLDGELFGSADGASVRVTAAIDEQGLCTQVSGALRDWLAGRRVPLIVDTIGTEGFALRPPAG